MAGDLKVSNGLARTDNLQMQIEGATLAAAGTVNLVDQALNLKVTAVLDREMSQKVGGTRIGGYMQTALANSRGELVIPALVSGTLAQPSFSPDAARMAEMKLKNLLPSAGPIREDCWAASRVTRRTPGGHCSTLSRASPLLSPPSPTRQSRPRSRKSPIFSGLSTR